MDELFMGSLFACGILSMRVKSELEVKATQLEKATHYLNCEINPSVVNGNGRCFVLLLEVMEECELYHVRELAKLIKVNIEVENSEQEIDTG